MENELASHEGAGQIIWLYGFFSLLLALLSPVIFSLLSFASLAGSAPLNFLKSKWQPVLKEEMRSWGQAMAWSLAFVLPGLYKFIQFLLVPYVVCFHPHYEQGKVDALKASAQMAKGHFLRLFILLGLFEIVFPVLMTLVDEYKIIWKTPIQALVICLVEMLLNLWLRSLQDEFPVAPAVSVEGH